MKRKFFQLTITTLLLCSSNHVFAQQESTDILDVCAKNVTLLTENDHVRFIQLKLKSGQKCGMHKSPGGFAYVISGASVNITKPDGTKTTLILKDSQAFPYTPEEHMLETARGNFDILLLENKK